MNSTCKQTPPTVTLYLSLFVISLHAYDQPYFYRAAYFLGEPRFEKEVLTSYDFIASIGHSHHARNICGDKTRLLDIYNIHNMHNISENVAPSGNSNVDTILQNLMAINVPPDSLFGHLSFAGTCTVAELITNMYQNMLQGFFFQCTIPIKQITINDICPYDLSSATDLHANRETPEWIAFLDNFNEIMSSYNLTYPSSIKHNGFGDIAFFTGWTRNYEKTKYLDFIDCTIKAGLLFPTGYRTDPDLLFDIPLGNNGHLGFPLYAAISFGIFDWLTIGCSTEFIPFKDDTRYMRTKTAPKQSGMITLHKELVHEHRGTASDTIIYFKSDHIPLNFSLIIGYSYTYKWPDRLVPLDYRCDAALINSDPSLGKWDMHTVHLFFEYDFTKEDRVIGRRLALLINIPSRGKNILDVTMSGINGGLDFSWNF